MSKRQDERSLVPLLVVSGIVLAPLIFILGIVAGSQIQLTNILTADSLSSWISALATVAIAVLTFVLAKETWYLREAQIEQVNELKRENIRPNVSVKLKGSNVSSNLMMVEIQNHGKGIARNVVFQFIDNDSNPIQVLHNPIVDKFLSLHIFASGMHSLGIGQKVEIFLFSFFDLNNQLAGDDIFSPFFKIHISFEDVEGKKYENELTIVFKEFKGITEIGEGDPLHQISGNIKKLREEFERLTRSSSNRLHVNTYSSTDRKEERDERERQYAERKRIKEEEKKE